MIVVNDQSGAARQVVSVIVRDTDNTARTIDQIWVRDAANIPRLVFRRGMRLRAVPPIANGSAASRNVTSDVVGVYVDGGTPPYLHSWTTIDTQPGPVIINFPGNPATNFSTIAASTGAIVRDTVTDSAGLTAFVDVAVVLNNTKEGSGTA